LQPEADPTSGDSDARQAHIAAALLASAAITQLGAALARGPARLLLPSAALAYGAIILPAAGFAIALWRGLRPRVGIVAFALLWSAYSVWAAVAVTRFTASVASMGGEPSQVFPAVPRWLVPLAAARSVAFAAAAVVLLTGRPRRSRRRAGTALAVAFVALFVAEQVYLLVI
jgi:hypothetical protein